MNDARSDFRDDARDDADSPSWWQPTDSAVRDAVKWKRDFPLAKLTWLKVGGPVQWLARVATLTALQQLVRAIPSECPLYMLGAGSNVLVRDQALAGVTLQLCGELASVSQHAPMTLVAFAGARDVQLAKTAARLGIGGLSPFATIPGSIGGALRMNAGAYGMETADRLTHATFLTAQAELVTLSRSEMQFSYRKSAWDPHWIAVSAQFSGYTAPPVQLHAEIARLQERRKQTQPVGVATGGSTFKNPSESLRAWQALEQASCRDLRLGDAGFSHIHANFLVNSGDASALELETVAESARDKVQAKTGIALDWEIIRWGKLDAATLAASKQQIAYQADHL